MSKEIRRTLTTNFESIEDFIRIMSMGKVSDTNTNFAVIGFHTEFGALRHNTFKMLKPEKTCFSISDCDEVILKDLDVETLIEDVMSGIKKWYEWGLLRLEDTWVDSDVCYGTFWALRRERFGDNKGHSFEIQNYAIEPYFTDENELDYYALLLYITPVKERIYNTTPIYWGGSISEVIKRIQNKRQ